MGKFKTADGKTVRPGMLLWTEDGQHVEKVESIDGDVVLSAYAATRWPKGMPVEQLYAEPLAGGAGVSTPVIRAIDICSGFQPVWARDSDGERDAELKAGG